MNKVILLVILCIALPFTTTALGSSVPGKLIYFPHIASSAVWNTEVGIVNISDDQLTGTLYGYDDSGSLIESLDIILAAGGRTSLIVGDAFQKHSQISNMKFLSVNGLFTGYEKFYKAGNRVAIPAVSKVNSGDIYVSHIASNSNWWTGLALLNTSDTVKNMTITFNDGSEHLLTLSAGQHWAGTINSFPGINASSVESAVISNGSGIIGLEIFGNNASTGEQYLSGVLLSDRTATSLYYPHVVSNSLWWTGMVAYNPNDTSITMTILPYDAEGNLLSSSTVDVAAGGKYCGSIAGLFLPRETQWFMVEASSPITGFELFGTNDGKQLAGYSTVNISTTAGTFVKVEDSGWTGIAFVNTDSNPAIVTLTALNNTGSLLTTTTLNIAGKSKQIAMVENLFASDITGATYVKFTSNRNIVGFQLNGSSDGMMLDGLPGLDTNSDRAGIFNANSATLSHLYYPMSVGDRFLYAGYGSFVGSKHTIEAESEEEIDGVNCLKIHYTTFVDETGKEDWWDIWVAQGTSDNIWILQFYDHEYLSLETYGADRAKLWIPANASMGMQFDGVMSGDSRVLSTTAVVELSTSLDSYEDCLVVSVDYSGDIDTTYYASGIGLVRDAWNDSGQINGWDLDGYDTRYGSGGTYATGKIIWRGYDDFDDNYFNTDIWYEVNGESPVETGGRLYLNYTGDNNIWVGKVSSVNGIQAELELSSNTVGNDHSDIQVGLAVMDGDNFTYSFVFELSSSTHPDKAQIEIAIYNIYDDSNTGNDLKYGYTVSTTADYDHEYNLSMIFNGDNVTFYVDGELVHEIDISAYKIDSNVVLFPFVGCWSKYDHSPAVGYVDNVQISGGSHDKIDFQSIVP